MEAGILTKQIGPLPVAGWIVGVGGGVAYLVYRNRNGGGSKSGTSGEGDATEESNSVSPFSGVGQGPGGWISTPLPQPAVEAPLLTNTQWADKASRELMARNYDPALVDSMVRKAVGGLAMTPAELVLFRLALSIVGPLPEINPPAQDIAPITPIIPGAPAVTVPVVTAPVANNNPSYNGIPLSSFPPGHVFGSTPSPPARYHIVAKGDTLGLIANHFYGSHSLWTKIYNANRTVITNPSVLTPGMKLNIPY